MSMTARFLAVAPARLKEMLHSPERIEALFTADVPLARFEFTPSLQERIRSQAPQALRTTLDRMPPDLRAQLLQNFAINESDLAGPAVGELIVNRMVERAAKLRPPPRQNDEPAARNISLDKAWHGLHYLLCGAAEPAPGPLGQAVFGGTEIGEDMGYGPARYFTVAQTAEIAQALQVTGLETTLRHRYDPDAMERIGIYPGGWHGEGPDWLVDAFRKLRDFYSASATAGQAVITAIE
jgi:hypothetical protein